MSNRQQRRRQGRQKIITNPDTGQKIRYTAGPTLKAPDEAYSADPLEGIPEGEHVWIISAVYRIIRPQDAFDPDIPNYMDLENLMSVMGPGCWRCEQVYQQGMETTVCPGEPS